jgi:PAS domain S-box-containing protein
MSLKKHQNGLSEYKKLIADLKESEQKYRHFFEKSPAMIYVIDRQGLFVNINRAGVEMLGYSSIEQVVGKRFDHFFEVPGRSLDSYSSKLEKTGILKDVEAKLVTRNKEIRYVQISAALRTTPIGKVKGYEGFVIDITSRKLAENRLAESEIRYKTVLDNSLAAIYMFQDGGYFSYVNPRMVNLLGYESADQLIGKPFWEIIASDDRQIVKDRGLKREQKEFEPRRYRFKMLRNDGDEILVDMQASHAMYLGKPAAVGNFIDITKEVKAEEQVRMLTRQLIEGIEDERRSLANDIHDEFGQALTSLQFEIESLRDEIAPEQKEAVRICAKINDQIQQLAESVRNTTSKLRPDLLDHLGLEPTLGWYVGDIAKRMPHYDITFQSAGLKRRLPSDVELVLYRVFQEGVNNIIKHAGARKISVQLTYSHPEIIFIIKDDGCGFEVSKHDVTGHDPRQGIGLLSMKERVASLDGTMAIRSEPGKGTVLRIKIPMSKIQPDESD